MVNRPSPTCARPGGCGKPSSVAGSSLPRRGDRRDGGKSLCRNGLSIILCVLCGSVVIESPPAGSGTECAKQSQFAVGPMAFNLFFEKGLRGNRWVLTPGKQSQFRRASAPAGPASVASPGPRCAKRTQFGGGQMGANCFLRNGLRRESRISPPQKQSQWRRSRAVWGGAGIFTMGAQDDR